jgi:hypothetical protein
LVLTIIKNTTNVIDPIGLKSNCLDNYGINWKTQGWEWSHFQPTILLLKQFKKELWFFYHQYLPHTYCSKQLFKEEMGLLEVMGLATRKCLKNNVQVEHFNKVIMIINCQTLKSIELKDDE